METKMAELEAKVNTLERENFMLRQVVKNATQGKTGARVARTTRSPRKYCTHPPRVVDSCHIVSFFARAV